MVAERRSKWSDVGGLSAARWSRVAPEGWGRGAEGGFVGWLLVVCIDRARRGTARLSFSVSLLSLTLSLSLFLSLSLSFSHLPRLSFCAPHSARNIHLPTRCFVHHFSLAGLFSVLPSPSLWSSVASHPRLDRCRCPRHKQAAPVPESTNADSELRASRYRSPRHSVIHVPIPCRFRTLARFR